MNQVQSDALDEVLVARAAMYGLLQRVFSDVPDRALAENESCEVMDQCFEVLGEAWGLRDCRTCKVGEGAGPKVPEQDIDAVPLTLEGEYNRLFVGVGKSAVCMWESIYATGINALFQPNTLEVRNVYLRNGFKPLGMGKVADDHMAIELAFMRELALEATRAGEAQRASLLTEQRLFLEEHLLRWVDAFSERVVEHDRSGYYRDYARLLADFVDKDAAFLPGASA